MAVKARALLGRGVTLMAALWRLGEAPVGAPGTEPFERWLWPGGRAQPSLRPPTPGGLTVWLTLGPPPHLPACRGEARRAGLQAAAVLLLPVPHLPLLVHGLWAALEAPRVALVLVDARGSEAEVARLLTSRRFYGLLRQKQAQSGARLVLLGDAWG